MSAAPTPPAEIQHLVAADNRLDDHMANVAEDLAPDALESPMDQRSLPPWPIQSEYDAMAWGFRVAQLRARAAWAKEMAKQIEREAAAAEQRLVFAIGGRRFTEGGETRTGFGMLEEWVRGHLPRGKKSLKTPAGTFGFRAVPSKLAVPPEREQALVKYCRKYAPHWLKVVETVSVSAIKEHIEETGEVPVDERGEQLVEFLPAGRRDSFSFSPAEGAAVMPLGTAAAAHRPRLEESVS